MAAITSLQDLFYGQYESKDAPNPRLASQLEDDSLIIALTEAITYPDGSVVDKPFILSIRDLQTKEPELIYVQAGELSLDGKTITLAGLNQRGLEYSVKTTIDFFSGDASRRVTHVVDSPVRISIAPQTQEMLVQFIQGVIASGANVIKVGDETDSDIFYYAKNADANSPFLKYVASSSKWVFSNDGVAELDLATGGVSTAGAGIDITAGTISIDLADGTVFVATSAGAGDSGKVVILDANGQIDQTFIGATYAEIEQALSGISANVNQTNLDTLTAGSTSDADSLHTHPEIGAFSNFFEINHQAIGIRDPYLQLSSDPTGDNIYLCSNDTGNKRIVRYEKDAATGAYIYKGNNTQLAAGTYNFSGNSGGITAGTNYVWFVCRGTTEVRLVRLDKDLTNPTAMTIVSGIGATGTDFHMACGDDTGIFFSTDSVANFTYNLTISGTNATWQTPISRSDGLLGQNVGGAHYDGTNLFFKDIGAGGQMHIYNTSSVLQNTPSTETIFSTDTQNLVNTFMSLFGVGHGKNGVFYDYGLSENTNTFTTNTVIKGVAYSKPQ